MSGRLNADPVILILEDERAQMLSLRAQLHGLGRLAEFMEPSRALDYAREHPCDAAIVDVGMPRASMDGLAFVRALREFDRDLAIIIHTGNDSDTIADEAIELRAVKRAVKSKTTLAELRVSTRDAIRETRERRETARQAREGTETSARLAEALGAYDLRLAASDVHRGLVQSLRDQLTTLSIAASAEKAPRTSELVAKLLDSVNTHLDSPWGAHGSGSRAAVNVGLNALRRYFQGSDRWAAERKSLALRPLMSDTFVECAPLELVNGLRHLAEYLLLRAAPGAEVTLAAAVVHDSRRMRDRLAAAPVVLNRESIRGERPYVVVTGSAPLASEVADVRADFAFGPSSGRTGNLHALGEVLSRAGGAVFIDKAVSGVVSIEAAFAVSL
ncbi:MAG TPA: response regulator [Opitutaceae bacterium]|jgi:CheY-like chemotaxis protein